MKTKVRNGGRLAAVVMLSVLGLAACGSDNDNDNPAAPPPAAGVPPPAMENGVPASAGVSVAAYIAYLRGLQTDETSSPVSIGGFVPPVDDIAAPTTLGS